MKPLKFLILKNYRAIKELRKENKFLRLRITSLENQNAKLVYLEKQQTSQIEALKKQLARLKLEEIRKRALRKKNV